MRRIILLSVLTFSACDDQATTQDPGWETSARPFDHQQGPGAQVLTLTGATTVEPGNSYAWTVSGNDLQAGQLVYLAWGTTTGAGRCPLVRSTGGSPCMDILGAYPIQSVVAVADPANPGQAIAEFSYTVPPNSLNQVYLQAFALDGTASSTTDVLDVTITQTVAGTPNNSKFAHPSTEAAILTESVACVTEANGSMWLVGMDSGGMADVGIGGDYDFDLASGLGTVFGQPAALNYELARRGQEVWFIDAFTGVDVYADEAAFNAGTVSQHFGRPGTSSRITIEGNQGYATWHSTDEINWFDTTTGALTNTVGMADWSTWVVGLSAVNGKLHLMDDGRGNYATFGRRVGVMDPSSGLDSCNVFLPRGGSTYPFDSSLPTNYDGLYCFTP